MKHRALRYRDISGKCFGSLTAMWPAGRIGKHPQTVWLCACECGAYAPVRAVSLANGHANSCGCQKIEMARQQAIRLGKASATHGMYGSPEYRAYLNAKDRCTNPNSRSWKYYGGRGIRFKVASFEDFMADVGRKPRPSLSIDRIDNEGHYELGNLRWATPSEQARNRRPHNRAA